MSHFLIQSSTQIQTLNSMERELEYIEEKVDSLCNDASNTAMKFTNPPESGGFYAEYEYWSVHKYCAEFFKKISESSSKNVPLDKLLEASRTIHQDTALLSSGKQLELAIKTLQQATETIKKIASSLSSSYKSIDYIWNKESKGTYYEKEVERAKERYKDPAYSHWDEYTRYNLIIGNAKADLSRHIHYLQQDVRTIRSESTCIAGMLEKLQENVKTVDHCIKNILSSMDQLDQQIHQFSDQARKMYGKETEECELKKKIKKLVTQELSMVQKIAGSTQNLAKSAHTALTTLQSSSEKYVRNVDQRYGRDRIAECCSCNLI